MGKDMNNAEPDPTQSLRLPETYPQWLSRVMYERGFTHADLAASVGVTRAAVSTWTTGKVMPRETMRPEIEKVLGEQYMPGLRSEKVAGEVAVQLMQAQRQLNEVAQTLAGIAKALGIGI